MIVAEYYGRVATSDLLDQFEDKGLLLLAGNLLKKAGVIDCHNDAVIRKVHAESSGTIEEIEAIKKDSAVREKLAKIQKQKVVKFYVDKLSKLFSDPAQLAKISALQGKDLRQAILELSEGIENHL